jgi:hypothetical protein
MRKQDLKNKVTELFRSVNLDRQIDRIVSSGCVDMYSYDNTYALPRIVTCVLAQKLIDDCQPFDPKYLLEIKNMEAFV